MAEQVINYLNFRLVRNAGEYCVVASERNILNSPIFGFAVNRIDRRNEIGARDPPAFMTLDAESRDHNPHQQAPPFTRSEPASQRRRSGPTHPTVRWEYCRRTRIPAQ